MNKKETEDFLLKTFDNVNYWVDYADKKSSYIITLFTVLSGFITFILDKYNDYILIFGSLLFLLSSLSPITDKFSKFKTENITDKDNLTYYGDISKYDNNIYKNGLSLRYETNISDNDYYFLDLINQIVINSKIAYRNLNF